MNCTKCRDLGVVTVVDGEEANLYVAVHYCNCPAGDAKWEQDIQETDEERRKDEELKAFMAKADAGEFETVKAWLENHP